MDGTYAQFASDQMSLWGHPFPHLNNAPITEAIIDFRVRLPAGFEILRLKEAHAQLSADYPTLEEQQVTQQQFEQRLGQPPKLTARSQGVLGYRFLSGDNKSIVQFRRNGFAFNRLKPYPSWDQVFPEACRLWKIYSAVAHPEEISRIAIRFINRIQLPLPNLELPDYLTAPPPLPQGVPQSLSGFLTRVVIQDPETKLAANVVQALEPPLNEQYVSMILDIDVYQRDVSQLTLEAVLGQFARLREMKNRIFFGSLTEKALALFR
jgi:uncharacterized protein (TIGR04255 family)